MNNIPTINSIWQHHNSNVYTVIMIANEYSTRLDEYPITIIYRGENGRVWSRTLDNWYRSFTLMKL